jgi:hypothetical protein
MTQPPLAAPTTTMRPCRPERNLIPNAQGASGVVPLPALSLHQKGAERSRRCSHPGCSVKNVRNSICILVCTTILTLTRRNCREEKQIENLISKSTGRKTLKTGESDPTFSAFSRPKSSWGRSRPFWFNPGYVSTSVELQVNARSHALFTLAFTFTFTRPSGVSRSVQTISIKSACGSCASLNHRVGLERPHFVATEFVAVAPAQSGEGGENSGSRPYNKETDWLGSTLKHGTVKAWIVSMFNLFSVLCDTNSFPNTE